MFGQNQEWIFVTSWKRKVRMLRIRHRLEWLWMLVPLLPPSQNFFPGRYMPDFQIQQHADDDCIINLCIVNLNITWIKWTLLHYQNKSFLCGCQNVPSNNSCMPCRSQTCCLVRRNLNEFKNTLLQKCCVETCQCHWKKSNKKMVHDVQLSLCWSQDCAAARSKNIAALIDKRTAMVKYCTATQSWI